MPLIKSPDDERIPLTEFGNYTKEKFSTDLLKFNEGRPLSLQQNILINESYSTMHWLAKNGVKFDPIYSRQCFPKDGKYIFWGGLTLATEGEGVGLIEAELNCFLSNKGTIKYQTKACQLIVESGKVIGVEAITSQGIKSFYADAVILGCGGFEANPTLRSKYIGPKWKSAMVRGTKYNQGDGIEMALSIGAAFEGNPSGCHAVPMDMNMPNYGNPEIPYIERKNYRKICYFLGVMLNTKGKRFVDEGINFRNYTYAQFGKAILEQEGGIAWQIFDSKVDHLLYEEYRFWDVSYKEANSLEVLFDQMERIDKKESLKTLNDYNKSVDEAIPFDPTVLDKKCTKGLDLNKTNWANKIDSPPFKAYPVRCGITFSYGGLKVDETARVIDLKQRAIEGLYACGELVGGVFYNGYPGGSGLTSGAVFGRIAGRSAGLYI